MTFTVGQKCQTRDGRDARVICVDRAGKHPIVALVTDRQGYEHLYSYPSSGIRAPVDGDDPSELIPPKRSGTFWVNVYDGYPSSCHGSKELALKNSFSPTRLACVEVQWTEGDGL